MDHQLLSVRPKGNSNGCHQRSTGARSIPWPAQIDMTGGKAHWAVIAVPATGDGWPNKGPASAALEWVALVAPGPRAEGDILPRSPWPRPGLASERISLHRREQIVVYQIRQFVWRQAWHDRVLRSVLNDGQRGSIEAQARSSQNTLRAHDGQHRITLRRNGRR
jgi:hypothetical protein